MISTLLLTDLLYKPLELYITNNTNNGALLVITNINKTINLFLSFLKILISSILTLLIMTLIIASITLIERKVLSLSQRRVGPNFVGYRGRLQYIADALKLFLKGFIVLDHVNRVWFILAPSLVFAVSYTFWLNSVWGSNQIILELEFNIVIAIVLSSLVGFAILITGYVSRNKYALLASLRALLMTINLELILGLFLVIVIFFQKSLSLSFNSNLQQYSYLVVNYLPIIGIGVLLFFLETGRAPFDLQEAESELVSGYNTEYGGFYFALYYLGEYFHLFFFALFLSTIWFGFEVGTPQFFLHFIKVIN